MLKIHLTDGIGTGFLAKVDDRQALRVSPFIAPPLEVQQVIPFRQFLTDDGLSTGSNDMQVDGSTTNVEFWVPAATDADRYITQLSFLIADAGATMTKFGNITALTNGCNLFFDRATGTITIHDTLKSNLDFVRLCLGQPAFGTAADSFRIKNAISTSEGYVPVLDLTKLVPPFGVKLDIRTNQRFVFKVRDDTRGVDAFDAIAYGFDRLE